MSTDSATTARPSICGARQPDTEELAAIACPDRNEKCQAPAYCHVEACRDWRARR